MALVLGIDTGGTFTDSVIYDLENQQVIAKAKSLTTYHDLNLGILDSIRQLCFDRFGEISLVSLSTTMATNAIVEGRGCEVGLLLIGEMPVGPLPVRHYTLVRGGHDIKGFPREELDLDQVAEALEELRSKVEVIAVSGFASVRNPEHELRVRELVREKMDLPVVCGHQLTTSLGFHERTVTAALNARLIPIITQLIAAVKKALSNLGITAPLMIVKGDGALMSEDVALEKPIETILSGPAASIIGATALTGVSQALVLDMGGTTTDIAVVQNGTPGINPEGARVGGWYTRVEAADVSTFGLGGDSQLWVNKDRQLNLGPQKVWPLSFVGAQHPYLLEELEVQRSQRIRLRPGAASDAYIHLRKYDPALCSPLEKKALALLESGPHSHFYLANALETGPFSFDLDRLVQTGIVAKVGVTPTDLLHARGILTKWDGETARLGIQILADTLGIPPEDFIQLAFDNITRQLCLAVLQSSLRFEGAPEGALNSLESDYLVNKLLTPQPDEIIHATMELSLPIVAIGAPVEAYLPEVAKRINARLIIPDHAEVANAVGAATGQIMERIRMTIQPAPDGYFLYSQWERRNFGDLDTAKAYAMKQAEQQATLMAERSGAVHPEIIKQCYDVYSHGSMGTHVETRIEVTVIGRPRW